MNKLYNHWINHKNVNDKYKEIMRNMSQDEIDVFFNEKLIQMGTAGYRAKIGPGNHNLNEFTYAQLTIGYAKYLITKYKNFPNQLSVLIVHDNRKNGDLYTRICANILKQYGIKVILNNNNDLLPTPIASYLIPKLGCIGCINITASHNPKEYNGFKCYDHTGCQLLPDDSNMIIQNMPNSYEILEIDIDSTDTGFEYVKEKHIDDYFADVKKRLLRSNVSENNRIKLVYSAMHGTASNYMSKFLNSTGYECYDVLEQNYPDSNFTNTPICNPEDPKSLLKAIELADSKNINIVFASDPDADRLAIGIKKNGEWVFLNGNQAGIIETHYRLMMLNDDTREKIVISTYISNNLIDRMVLNQGYVIRTATGFKWVGDQINNLDFNKQVYVNGFEEAIGALPTDLNRDKDSFQTALLMLEILNYYYDKGYDYIDILENEIYPKYGHWYGNTTSLVIDGLNWKEKAEKMLNKLMVFNKQYVLERQVINVIYNDAGSCLEIYFKNDSWVKFRLSGTEPKFKIYLNLYLDNDSNDVDYNISKQLQAEAENIVQYFKEFLFQ